MHKILLVACQEPEALSQRLCEFAQEAGTDLECIIADNVDEAIDLYETEINYVLYGCLDGTEGGRLMNELRALGFKGSVFAAA